MFTAAAAAAKSLQSCLTLCDPMDSSPPGSSTGVDAIFFSIHSYHLYSNHIESSYDLNHIEATVRIRNVLKYKYLKANGKIINISRWFDVYAKYARESTERLLKI